MTLWDSTAVATSVRRSVRGRGYDNYICVWDGTLPDESDWKGSELKGQECLAMWKCFLSPPLPPRRTWLLFLFHPPQPLLCLRCLLVLLLLPLTLSCDQWKPGVDDANLFIVTTDLANLVSKEVQFCARFDTVRQRNELTRWLWGEKENIMVATQRIGIIFSPVITQVMQSSGMKPVGWCSLDTWDKTNTGTVAFRRPCVLLKRIYRTPRITF